MAFSSGKAILAASIITIIGSGMLSDASEVKLMAPTMEPIITTTPGQVTFGWTAPGDDGNVGTAHDYVIKYSLNSINEANWAAATLVSNPPTPLPAGSPQSFTISGLNRGQQYYVGFKTCDDVHNISQFAD